MKEAKEFRVSSKSEVGKVAGAIAKSISDGYSVIVKAIGAGAVNQMVKSCIVARGMVASNGKDLYFSMGFDNESINQEKYTCIKFFSKVE
jgi:stage V sporulation protein SpoVS